MKELGVVVVVERIEFGKSRETHNCLDCASLSLRFGFSAMGLPALTVEMI